MTQITIPALPAGAALDGSEPLETVQNGVSVRTTVGAIASLAAASAGGTQGPAGPSGADGIGVSSASINISGHLIITLTNGSQIDAGLVSGTGGGGTGAVALTLSDGSPILLTDGSGLTE